jgi:matrixin
VISQHRAPIVATLLIAMAAIVVAGAVGAAHWPAGAVIRVWVDPVGAPAGGAALVERAMRTWTDAAQGRFRLERTSNKDGAGVRVHFFTRDWRYGMTQARPDPQTGLITDAEVVVAADADGDALDHRIVIYLTALHELGHALGLSHSADIRDIMYLFRLEGDGERFFGAYRKRLRSADDIGSAPATGLSAEDVRVLRSLYD